LGVNAPRKISHRQPTFQPTITAPLAWISDLR
jgi:hypothetical protein